MVQVFRDGDWIEEGYVGPDKWPLPPPATIFWRLPIIRHLRFAVLAWRITSWYGMWGSLGYYANGYDARVLDAIWRGKV